MNVIICHVPMVPSVLTKRVATSVCVPRDKQGMHIRVGAFCHLEPIDTFAILMRNVLQI